MRRVRNGEAKSASAENIRIARRPKALTPDQSANAVDFEGDGAAANPGNVQFPMRRFVGAAGPFGQGLPS
jgi:hypothetical protein